MPDAVAPESCPADTDTTSLSSSSAIFLTGSFNGLLSCFFTWLSAVITGFGLVIVERLLVPREASFFSASRASALLGCFCISLLSVNFAEALSRLARKISALSK